MLLSPNNNNNNNTDTTIQAFNPQKNLHQDLRYRDIYKVSALTSTLVQKADNCSLNDAFIQTDHVMISISPCTTKVTELFLLIVFLLNKHLPQ